MNSRQLITAIYTVGAVMTLAGAAVYVTRWPLAPWLYTTGAVLFAFAQICSPLTVTSFTLKRLRMQQVFGSLALGAGRTVHVLHPRQRMDCLPPDWCRAPALHRDTHPARGEEGKSREKRIAPSPRGTAKQPPTIPGQATAPRHRQDEAQQQDATGLHATQTISSRANIYIK